MSLIARTATGLAEAGLVPDAVIRRGIRQLVRHRRSEITADGASALDLDSFVSRMDESEIALVPDLANEQHYELPAEFFVHILGSRLKYSCCYWPGATGSIDAAEEAALEATCWRAKIKGGQRILDLGCGWGSFTLWVAEHFPSCEITAVSNSAAQREFIEQQAAAWGFSNVTAITADVNEFSTDHRFDRIVSVEMFEHVRNYRQLFGRISEWLNDDGLFFMHIFCHQQAAYEYVDAGPADWMSRYFFSGGIMPSQELPLQFPEHLTLVDRWRWDGTEYQRTAQAWLDSMDRRKDAIMQIFAAHYGREADRWWMRWRMFFLAVAEMFGYADGREWGVGHYLFRVSQQNDT